MNSANVDIQKIAGLFTSRWNRHYTASKLKTDPLYSAVFKELAGTKLPLLDIGCGLGLLSYYLRERGFAPSVQGVDYDGRKIDEARTIASSGAYHDLQFDESDARGTLPDFRGNVTILDILQFMDHDQQAELLGQAAGCVAEGGKLVLRSGLQDKSWRFRITHWGDLIAKASFWMKAAPVCYPTKTSLSDALKPHGFTGTFTPLWGNTPFNNYLIVFERDGKKSK